MRDIRGATPFRKRIAYKQARDVVLISFCVGFVLSLMQVYFDFRTEAQSFGNTIRQVVNTVHQPAARSAYHLDVELAEEVAHGLFEFNSIISVGILDDSANQLTYQVRGELDNVPRSEQPLNSQYESFRWISESIFGKQQEYRIKLNFDEDASVEAGEIRVLTDTHLMAIHLYERSAITLLSGLIRNFVLAIILSVVFYYRLAKPFHSMAETLSKIDPNQPSRMRLAVPDHNKGDEIEGLAESVNALLRVVGERNLERDVAESNLRKTAESLEETVKERTAKLQETALKAQAASLAKSNFLATMSHEIRTPLNGVLGLAQLLTHSDLNEEQRSKVDTILTSGQTLLAIINDVLDMSRIEAGGVELENLAFNLSDLVTTTAVPFQNLADEKGVTLRVVEKFDPGLVIKGDAVRLRQILLNLLSNAVKFTENGNIILSVEEIAAATAPVKSENKQVIHFSVADSGVGISEDRLEAIFDAFTQEDSSTTREFGGTGLGLAIVKQLTELMHGRVTVDSNPGKGSVFHVYLPMEATATDAQEAAAWLNSEEPDRKTSALNILIVEDNDLNAMIVQAFLEKFGHKASRVVNGKLAVETVATNPPDLILMDVHMPVMNGVDATKIIRSTEQGKDLPIIGLTAEAFEERHVLFRKSGMNAILTKPFTESQLSDILSQYGFL